MKKSLLMIATAASLLAVSFSSQAASFNCKKASKPTERAICANQRLNEADTKLTTAASATINCSGCATAISAATVLLASVKNTATANSSWNKKSVNTKAANRHPFIINTACKPCTKVYRPLICDFYFQISCRIECSP